MYESLTVTATLLLAIIILGILCKFLTSFFPDFSDIPDEVGGKDYTYSGGRTYTSKTYTPEPLFPHKDDKKKAKEEIYTSKFLREMSYRVDFVNEKNIQIKDNEDSVED